MRKMKKEGEGEICSLSRALTLVIAINSSPSFSILLFRFPDHLHPHLADVPLRKTFPLTFGPFTFFHLCNVVVSNTETQYFKSVSSFLTLHYLSPSSYSQSLCVYPLLRESSSFNFLPSVSFSFLLVSNFIPRLPSPSLTRFCPNVAASHTFRNLSSERAHK